MQSIPASSAPSRSQRVRYEQDGFLLCPQIGMPEELARRAAAGLEAVRDGNYDTGHAPDGGWKAGGAANKLVKIEQPQLGSNALREAVSFDAIGRIALELTGAEWVQVWWVQGLIKPSAAPGAAVSTNVGWHQDRQYWKLWSKESELFTAWLALSDVPEASGPMIFARGSHQWGLLDQGDFFGQDQASIRNGIQVPAGRSWEEVPAILPLGGVSFHHNLTFHGSGTNTSGFPRMSLALHMRTQNSAPDPEEKEPWLMKWVKDESVCPIWRR